MFLDPKSLCLVPLLLAGVASAQVSDVGPVRDVGQLLRAWALAGELEAVRTLLEEESPDLDAADESGWTALMYAVRGGHPEIVETLLEAGASVGLRNEHQETGLHLAARHGSPDSALLLLQAGADFELKDSEGRTPLYRAIERRRTRIIEMLQRAAAAKGRGLPSGTTAESPDEALPPTIVESTPAQYTEEALAAGIEGRVVLMVLVRRDGSVGAASVSEGLEPSLDRSALRTVRDWKFAPAMRNGRTVEIVMQVEMDFQLPKEP